MVWSQYSILNIVIHGAQTPKYKIVYVNHLPEYCPVMSKWDKRQPCCSSSTPWRRTSSFRNLPHRRQNSRCWGWKEVILLVYLGLSVYKETIPIITKSLQKWKLKPVIEVLDEHVALSTSFSSITPPVVLIKSCLHDQNQIGVTWDPICLPDHSQGLTWHYGSPQQSDQTSAHASGLLTICVIY